MAKENLKSTAVTAIVAVLLGGGGGVGVQRIFPSRPQREISTIGQRFTVMETTLQELKVKFSTHLDQQGQERAETMRRLEKQDIRAETSDEIAHQLSVLVAQIGRDTQNIGQGLQNLGPRLATIESDIKKILEGQGHP